MNSSQVPCQEELLIKSLKCLMKIADNLNCDSFQSPSGPSSARFCSELNECANMCSASLSRPNSVLPQE